MTTMTRILLRPASFVMAFGLMLATVLPVSAQVVLPIRMRAFAVNMSNNLTGANGILQIVLDKWSTNRNAPLSCRPYRKGKTICCGSCRSSP